MAVFEYRLGKSELYRAMRDRVDDQGRETEDLHDAVTTHTEQISGDGGLQNGMKQIRAEIRSLRTAFYALTGAIITGTFAMLAAVLSHAL